MTRDLDVEVAVAAFRLLRSCQSLNLLDDVDDEIVDQLDEMVSLFTCRTFPFCDGDSGVRLRGIV